MQTQEPSRLADMALFEAATAAADMRVADVADVGQTWIVVVDGPAPVAAAPAAALQNMPTELSLRAAIRAWPPAVIAHSAALVTSSLSSWAFTQMSADAPVVVVDDAGSCRVWAGEDLAEVRDWVGRRSAAGPLLIKNPSHIPKICRHCRFESGQELCCAPILFSEYPDPMPDCPNPNRLGLHQFAW
jgi:hypothetical protein